MHTNYLKIFGIKTMQIFDFIFVESSSAIYDRNNELVCSKCHYWFLKIRLQLFIYVVMQVNPEF